MIFTFSFANALGGNGFLAVYLAAIYLGNQEILHRKKFIKTFDGFAWLMQIVLFLTLGLLVFPTQIVPVITIGIIISLFLIIVARPLSVFVSLLFFKIQNRSRLFISWVGLRGAVPIVFATYPLLAGVEQANMIFNIVFFISITSLIIQGTTVPVVARLLHLTLPEKAKQRTKTDIQLSETMRSLLTQITIPEGCDVINKPLYELGIPDTSLITLIERNGQYIVPCGTTSLMAGDNLFLISENNNDLEKVYKSLSLPYPLINS